MTFASPSMQTVAKAVGAVNGVVYVHLGEGMNRVPANTRQQYLDALEGAIRDHPEITFAFHYHQFTTDVFDYVAPLMSRYPNVFFSWDVGHFLNGSWGDLMRREAISAQQFAAVCTQVGILRIVEESVRFFLPMLQRFPDRMMWATDQRSPWNYDPQAHSLMVDISRQFIARLPAELQEAYAYRNALRAFGKYLEGP